MNRPAPLPWQAGPWRQLTGAAQQGRLPHALLLAGPRGVGKRRFADALAGWLLCEGAEAERPCGACRACAQLAAGTHPDAGLLGPDGHVGLHPAQAPAPVTLSAYWRPAGDSRRREIAIDAIRSAIGGLELTTHYGRGRVLVIDPADALNVAGVNALLKTVEEPPPGACLVLVSERWRQLPATLRSRCRIVRFPPPTDEQGAAWLRERHPGQHARAPAWLRRAPLRADRELEAAGRQEQWGRWLRDSTGGRMPFLGEIRGVTPEEASAWLEWLYRAAAEALRVRLAGQGPAGPVPAAARAPALLGLVDDAVEGLRGLERNVNPTLIVEWIMIRWSQATGHPA